MTTSDLSQPVMLAKARDLSPAAVDELVAQVSELMSTGRTAHPHRLDGERTSNLFALVIASLGEAVMVKGEDAGDLYAVDQATPPDWRVVLRDGRQYLIEVKNFRFKLGSGKRFSMRVSDLKQLENYASVVGVPLLIAIYWSAQTMWTLLPPVLLVADKADTNRRGISFGDAVVHSEMSLLGDRWIGSSAPLRFQVDVVEKSRNKESSSTDEPGTQSHILQIEKISLFCADQKLTDQAARKFASYLMFYGGWEETTSLLKNDAGLVTTIDFSFAPPAGDVPPPPACLMHSPLSRMMSAEFMRALLAQVSKVMNCYRFA